MNVEVVSIVNKFDVIRTLRGEHETEEIVSKKTQITSYSFELDSEDDVFRDYETGKTTLKGKVEFYSHVEARNFFCIYTYVMRVSGLEYPFPLWVRRSSFQLSAEELSEEVLRIHKDKLNELYLATDYCGIEIRELYVK